MEKEKVHYKINGKKFTKRMHVPSDEFFELCSKTNNIRIPKSETLDNNTVYYRMNQEGLDYFLLNCFRFTDLKDKKARKLFKKAAENLENFKNYIESNRNEEEF